MRKSLERSQRALNAPDPEQRQEVYKTSQYGRLYAPFIFHIIEMYALVDIAKRCQQAVLGHYSVTI